MSGIWPYVAALIPSAGVAFLFYVVMKNVLESDRRERLAHSQWEAEQDRLGKPDVKVSGPESTELKATFVKATEMKSADTPVSKVENADREKGRTDVD